LTLLRQPSFVDYYNNIDAAPDGSTAVVLFEKDKMTWDAAFKANSTVVMGEVMGHTV